MRKEIEELLNSEVSAYAISKASGVSTSVILDLRNKKRKLDNLSLLNAERLFNYYEEVLRMSEEIKRIKELAKRLNGADGQPSIRVYKDKEQKLIEWESNGDEDVDWKSYAKETLADFDEKEYVIEVLWTDGVPEYFHEDEVEEVVARI